MRLMLQNISLIPDGLLAVNNAYSVHYMMGTKKVGTYITPYTCILVLSPLREMCSSVPIDGRLYFSCQCCLWYNSYLPVS